MDVNYHAVNDFCRDDGELLDELLTGNVAAVGAPTLPQLFVTEVRACTIHDEKRSPVGFRGLMMKPWRHGSWASRRTRLDGTKK